MNKHTITISVNGRDLIFETGTIARQANGAVVLRCGETVLLSTACANFEPTQEDFLPLRVDYTEKFSSAGKTLGGFIKREGKPSERETLICRLIDRPLRPMFENGYFHDTQIVTTVLSYDGIHAPDPLAVCAASAALVISNIPLIKPVAAVRVGFIDNSFVVNPTVEEQKRSTLDLLLAGTEDAILMIEGYCDFFTEEQLLAAVDEGHLAIQTICKGLADWQNLVGKEKNRSGLHHFSEELLTEVENLISKELRAALEIIPKLPRELALAKVKETVTAHFFPEGELKHRYSHKHVATALKTVSSNYMRNMILSENKRCDGRSCETIRPISIDLDLLPRTHGSVLFTRGETQTIAVCTLGGETMGQRYEELDEEGTRGFYLQYSFPPFSVGEVGRIGPPGRREVGHGKLAERALTAVLPPKDDFPYTIRLESNITESNGSSSMASVCGGCLAMMAGGVPIKRPIAGIAMGLILETDRFAILSDILGVEDAFGDMDFKITGDEKGITAFQLDIKVEGINRTIMQAALAQAKEGRIHILNKMLEACPESKKHLSKHAPKIEILRIKPSKIGELIGPGGKQIRAIIEETGVDININDDGIVNITSNDAASIERAKEIVKNLTSELEINGVYTGKIVSIKEFGLFVRIFNRDGLCHISEVSKSRIDDLTKHFKEGDSITVKVVDINDRGQVKLSRKILLEEKSAAV